MKQSIGSFHALLLPVPVAILLVEPHVRLGKVATTHFYFDAFELKPTTITFVRNKSNPQSPTQLVSCIVCN